MPSPYRNSSMRPNGRASCAKPCAAMHRNARESSLRIADDLLRTACRAVPNRWWTR